jgi:hypothetical protein
VTAVTPLRPQTQGAERKRQVIHYDQQVLQGDFLFLHPIADGFSAKVHVGIRFQQDERAPFHPHLAHRPVTLVLKNSIGRLGEGVQHTESYIMSRILIFRADIT